MQLRNKDALTQMNNEGFLMKHILVSLALFSQICCADSSSIGPLRNNESTTLCAKFLPVQLDTVEKANWWLEIALLHHPDDVYCGLAPYSDSALEHAKDALFNGADPNGSFENGLRYRDSEYAEFRELLIQCGAVVEGK